MSNTCAHCGAAMEPGTRFCVACGKAVDAAEAAGAQPAQPREQLAETFSQPVAAQPAQAAAPNIHGDSAPASGKAKPRAEKEVKPIGFFWSLGYLLLMNIPVLGLILSIIWGLKASPKNRSNLARAMIFIHIIWIAVIVLLIIWAYPFLHQIAQGVDFSIKIFGYELR